MEEGKNTESKCSLIHPTSGAVSLGPLCGYPEQGAPVKCGKADGGMKMADCRREGIVFLALRKAVIPSATFYVAQRR